MKIYTKTGDDGSTGLIGGSRVQKNDPRLEVYGTVDELNSVIGLARVAVPVELDAVLAKVQDALFVLGSHLATPGDAPPNQWLPPLREALIAEIESDIDRLTDLLPPLKNFILPGGSESAARLHVARTVCRRAERLLVGFATARRVPEPAIRYLNRLSDWLFVAARRANQLAGVDDVPWVPDKA